MQQNYHYKTSKSLKYTRKLQILKNNFNKLNWNTNGWICLLGGVKLDKKWNQEREDYVIRKMLQHWRVVVVRLMR
jgi:hypothetical protein